MVTEASREVFKKQDFAHNGKEGREFERYERHYSKYI